MEKAGGRVKACGVMLRAMARSDPDKLAQALRANLVRRKERMRAAQAGDAIAAAPPVMSGADEEGDVVPAANAENDAAWVSIGSKKA